MITMKKTSRGTLGTYSFDGEREGRDGGVAAGYYDKDSRAVIGVAVLEVKDGQTVLSIRQDLVKKLNIKVEYTYPEIMNEIQKRLMRCIGTEGGAKYSRALGLALHNGANLQEMTDAFHLALWFEGAPKNVKQQFLDEFNEKEDNLRVCSKCGCFMYEGYILGDEYACSDECAVALYDGDEPRLRADIEKSMNGGPDDFFWTEW